MKRHGRPERRATSPTPILLEPILRSESVPPGDFWPIHEGSLHTARGKKAKENGWVPAGRAGSSEVQKQKEDAENKEPIHMPRQPPSGGSPGCLQELVGNSTPVLQIQVLSPTRARTSQANPAVQPQKGDVGAKRKETGDELPLFLEFQSGTDPRVGTPEYGAIRGSLSLSRPLSSGRAFLGMSRPGSRQSNSRPNSGFGRSSVPRNVPFAARAASGIPPDSKLGAEAQAELDRECAAIVGKRADCAESLSFLGGRCASECADLQRSSDPLVRRTSTVDLQSRSRALRSQSSLNSYPTSTDESPTTRWNIDSEIDSTFDGRISRMASRIRRSRPATSLGLTKPPSPREQIPPGVHSSEVWGSLNSRARKAADDHAEQLHRLRRLRSSPSPTPERHVFRKRAVSAPTLWNPRASSANGEPPPGRQASLWAYHTPADAVLRKARSAAAARLKREIELYKENSFQRELLEERVEKHHKELLQQRRQLMASAGDLVERNRSNLDQHGTEERNKRIAQRASAHRERWDAIVERHVARQQREEAARDELILAMSNEQEEARKAEERERLRLFKLERRRWWATFVALGGRLQLLAETLKVQREVRRWERRRLDAARCIQVWFRDVRARMEETRQNQAATTIQRFARDVVIGQKERRRGRYAALIALFLGDLQRSQALMLAFRTFRQRVMTIQRVVGLRTLRIRAQVALVLRQWEVAEENWIKTHELTEEKPLPATTKRSLRRVPTGSSSVHVSIDGRRSNSDVRRSNSLGQMTSARSKTDSDAGGKGGSVPEAGGTSADVRRSAAAHVGDSRRSTVRLTSGEQRQASSDKPSAKTLKGKPAKPDSAEKHRLLFDLRDGVLGPEYASSGVHVPQHIQEQVAKDFCMQRRREHVKVLDAWHLQRAESQRAARDAEMIARARQMMQSGKAAATSEVKRPVQAPRMRVLATRTELQGMMLEGLAKAAVETLAANPPAERVPGSEGNSEAVPPTQTSPVTSRRGTREAQAPGPGHVAPAGSRKTTREVTVMAAIIEQDAETGAIASVVNLLGHPEVGAEERRATKRLTSRKVTWNTDAGATPTVPE